MSGSRESKAIPADLNQPLVAAAAPVVPNSYGAISDWTVPQAKNPHRKNYAVFAVRKTCELLTVATMACVFTLAAKEDQNDHDNYMAMVASLFQWKFEGLTLPTLFQTIGAYALIDAALTAGQYGRVGAQQQFELSGPKVVGNIFAAAMIIGTIVASTLDKTMGFPLVNGLFFASQALNWLLGVKQTISNIYEERGLCAGMNKDKGFTFEFNMFSSVLAMGVAFFCFNFPLVFGQPAYMNGYVGSGCAALLAMKKIVELGRVLKNACRKYQNAEEANTLGGIVVVTGIPRAASGATASIGSAMSGDEKFPLQAVFTDNPVIAAQAPATVVAAVRARAATLVASDLDSKVVLEDDVKRPESPSV